MRLGYALTGNNKAKLANERERERESKRASERAHCERITHKYRNFPLWYSVGGGSIVARSALFYYKEQRIHLWPY